MFDKDTVDYYDSHYDIVYHNYEKAVLSELHDYLLKVFPEKKSAILDIGAGTGRDMRFLLKKGYDVYGIDGILLSAVLRLYYKKQKTSFSAF